jgi:HSP20 family protein
MNSGFEDFYNVLDDFFTPRSIDRSTFKLDVQEDEKQYIIEAEMPGAKKEEISLDLEDGRLTISLKREENTEETRKNYLHRERRAFSMSRAIYLADAKPDDIKAKLDNGVLTVSVLKQDKQVSARRIEIE